ncbi:RHS repeat-associated core domain-containing protein [Vibrio harveyi]|uniref:RHS repeat-associated core domain-containing protein n=1 Tax=Vibrio harveyi TaxID=669 RepID=UPI0036F41BB3
MGQVEGGSFSGQPFGYSTKCCDFASGLVYFGYRFYSSYQRRWLNRDPLQEQGGINLYAYVNGDPLGYIDPDGRFVLVSPPPPLPIGLPINQMTGNSPNNGWVDSPEASLMHDYYKNSCGPKLPPSGDECQDYRNEANQASMCAHLRSQWVYRFWPGRHTKAILDSQRMAKKYNRLADDCERAREVMNCQ